MRNFSMLIYFVVLFSFIYSINSNDTVFIDIDDNKNFTLPDKDDLQEIQKNIISPYYGGWPINLTKDSINGSKLIFDCPGEIGCPCINSQDCLNNNCLKSPKGKYCYPMEGDVFPEFHSLDQYEEEVNIYDFAHNNKYILIELATVWCGACNVLANWLAYNNQEIQSKPWWKDEYQQIYNFINDGKVYFITILYENEHRNSPTYNDSYEWFNNYPDDKIPILIDTNKSLHKWVKPTGIPTILLLNENMEIVTFTTRGLNDSFDNIIKLINKEDD